MLLKKEFLAGLLAIAGSMTTQSAGADNLKIPDFYAEPGRSGGRAYVNGVGNETVDPFSGGLSIQYRDILLPGDGGLDIVVSRVYRSLQGVEPHLEQRRERNAVGIGWDIHFGRVWTAPNTVLCDTAGATVTGPKLPSSYRNPVFEAADGSRKVLVTEYEAATPYHMISKDRWIATCLSPAKNPYSDSNGLIVQSPDGMKYTLGIRGRIEIGNREDNLPLLVNRIEDRNGNWIRIHYDRSSSAYALIDRVTSSDGRKLNFSYTIGSLREDVRLRRITAFPNTPFEQVWTYSHTPAKLTSGLFTSPWYLLTGVQSPEREIAWHYRYYPDDPDGPDPEDGKYDPGRLSLRSVRVPEGAVIKYVYGAEYFDVRARATAIPLATTVVTHKTRRDPGGATAAWRYRYLPKGAGAGQLDALVGDLPLSRLDETHVVDPEGCTTYKHVGIQSIDFNANDNRDDGVWAVGLLLEKRRYAGTACGGTILDKKTYRWGRQLISAQNEFRPSRSAIDENTYAAVLLEEATQRDGSVYSTLFSGHDRYGNPGTVVEQGQGEKTTQYTYAVDTGKWLLRLVESETLSGAGVITRRYDANGNMTEENRYGVPTRFLYHANGNLAVRRDTNDHDIRYSDYYRGVPGREDYQYTAFDSSGQVQTFTIRTLTRVVNPTGTAASETDGRGFTTVYGYDRLNRVISIQRPRGATTRISRPTATELRLTRGRFQRVEHRDGIGRLVAVRNRDLDSGESIGQTLAYDALGRKVFESYPDSAQGNVYTYDTLGRRLSHAQPDGVVTRYRFEADNRVLVTDPRGNTTRLHKRSFGNPDAGAIVRIDSPEGVVTHIDRNLLDQVVAYRQGGLTRTYEYDARFFLVSETHPETGRTDYRRDAVGNKIAETRYDNGVARTTKYGYDAIDRLTRTTYPDTSGAGTITYAYDGNDNIESLARGTTRWDYAYDADNNLTQETLTVSGNIPQRFELTYGYDDLDALTSVTYPDGLRVDYSPNAFGWPTKVGGFVPHVAYHPSGHIHTLDFANGIRQTFDLNARLLPAGIHAGDAVDQAYDYDLAGNVTGITDHLAPEAGVAMAYDDINRLVTANGSWGVGEYAYDVLGNLTLVRAGAGLTGYSYDPDTNLLASVIGERSAQIAYDYLGNVTTDGGHEYGYNDASELVRIAGGANFLYDGNGRRVLETDPNTGDVIYSVYDSTGQILYDYDQRNDIGKDYVRLGARLIATRESRCDATSTDTDADGMPDCYEASKGFDPDDPSDGGADADGDGLSNVQEFAAQTDPYRADSDADGMADAFEVRYGLNPAGDDAAADTDGDGFTNLQEYTGLSDPTDATSVPLGAVEWRAQMQGYAAFPAVADNGDIYVLTSDGVVNRLYTFDAGGAARRVTTLDGQGAGCGFVKNAHYEVVAPAGQVAVTREGSVIASCDGGGTYAFDAAGNPLWSVARGGYLAVAGGRVYVSTVSETGLHAFTDTGTPLWTYAPDVAPFGDSLVVGSEGTAYVVTGCSGKLEEGCHRARSASGELRDVEVHAIGPDGELKWVNGDVGEIFGRPGIGIDGSLYLGSSAGQWFPRGGVLALNADGSRQRRSSSFATGGESIPPTNPVMDEQGNVYTSTLGIGALGADLGRRWQGPAIRLNYGMTSPLIAGNGHLYTSERELTSSQYSLDLQGRKHWATEFLKDEAVGNLAIHPEGSLLAVAQGETSTLYALTNDTDAVVSSSNWAMRGGNPRQSRALDPCPGEDSDGDGVTDCYERWIGNDPLDGTDVSTDEDGDGLWLVQEFALGTSPRLADTDGDAMPDDFELDNGLDPRSNTSLQDSDDDGAIDAIEFALGSDVADAASAPQPGQRIWSYDAMQPALTDPVSVSGDDVLFAGVAHLDYLGNAIASRATEGDSPEVNPVVSGRGRIIFPRAASSTRFKIVVPSLWADHAVSGTFSVPPGHGFAAAAEDILYTAAGTELIAVDDTGDTLWRYDISVDPVTGEPTGVTGGLSTPPVVDAQGNILFGNADGLVFAIAPDGAPLWSFATAGAIAAVPAIGADGTVYAVSADASLYALTPQGSLLWSLPLGATVSTSPVIGVDSTIYVATDDGRLYAVGPDGAMSWSLELEATIRSDPVIGADNRIYIGAGDGEFYAVDPDGGIAWQASLGAPVSPGSPFIDNQGVLYVATQDNKVQGLYAGARGLADSPWPTVSHDMHRSGNVATRVRTADAIP